MPRCHIAAPADRSVASTRDTTSVDSMEIATPPQHTALGEDFDSTGDEAECLSLCQHDFFTAHSVGPAKSRHLHRQIFPQAPRAPQLPENLGTLVW